MTDVWYQVTSDLYDLQCQVYVWCLVTYDFFDPGRIQYTVREGQSRNYLIYHVKGMVQTKAEME